ncbi:MAG: Txe/YoeB family addiction module toxin [Desulfobacterales bacterium]|nr:Txe/YoeB family addiction module toxin [Desulfobacterales bacterium]
MKIQFTEEAWKDFEWFLENDKRIIKRIRELLKDIGRQPEEGIGKPERLRFQLSGCWSRRKKLHSFWPDFSSQNIPIHYICHSDNLPVNLFTQLL